MIVGGVEPTESNLRAWFEAWAYGVGIGSNLITKQLVKNQDYSQIQQGVSHTLGIVRKLSK